MSGREYPAWMYRYPDSGDTRIPDLQAKVLELENALLESNDTAAKLAAALQVRREEEVQGRSETAHPSTAAPAA